MWLSADKNTKIQRVSLEQLLVPMEWASQTVQGVLAMTRLRTLSPADSKYEDWLDWSASAFLQSKDVAGKYSQYPYVQRCSPLKPFELNDVRDSLLRDFILCTLDLW